MALVAALAIAASITGLTNSFAYDDVHVIVRNPDLHTLEKVWHLFFVSYWRPEYGAFLYRPLTSVGFAVQWVIGGGSPLPFHLLNILLYAACSVALYHLARTFVPQRAAIIAGVVFAVHPLHVEAVANVSGQGELWVALLMIVTVDYYVRLRRTRTPNWRDVAIIATAYLVGCGFKEHAIILPGLLVGAELILVDDGRRWAARARAHLPLLVAMVFVAGAFVAARHAVLLGVSDDSTSPLLRGQPFGTRLFTMLSVVMEWVRLFVWPADLSADYSFSRLRVYTGFSPVMIPGLLALAGASWLAVAVRRSNRGFTFGMFWAGVALLIPSNLMVVTGFVLAERTLFLATVGIAICIGTGLHEVFKVAARSRTLTRGLVTAVVLLVLAASLARSMTRSTVWHDNDRLFRQTIDDAPSSGRAHWMLAAHLLENKKMPEALEEMDLAIALGGRNDAFMLGYGGDLFATAGRCPRAIVLYRRALELTPDNVRLRANASRCLLLLGRPADAKAIALGGGKHARRDVRLQNFAFIADSVQRANPQR
jgi:hypothetical protein